MARILRDDVIVKKRIEENVRTGLNKFQFYLDSAPTFVSYYHQEMIHSTADNNLDSVYQVVGSESPLKFNRIDKFPVYGLSALSLEREENEFGPEADPSLDCIVLPGTIVPLENDLMSIEYVNDGVTKKNLYRVTKVNKAIQGTKSFYQLSISFEPKQIALVEKQVEKELEFSVPDYEANKVPIFDIPLKHILNTLRTLRYEFGRDYSSLFYQEKSSCFEFPAAYDIRIVNFYLNYFCEKEELFEFDRFFYDTKTVFKYPTTINRLIANHYKKTIFHQFIHHLINEHTNEKQFNLIETSKNEKEDEFYSFPETYYDSVFSLFDITDLLNCDNCITKNQEETSNKIKNKVHTCPHEMTRAEYIDYLYKLKVNDPANIAERLALAASSQTTETTVTSVTSKLSTVSSKHFIIDEKGIVWEIGVNSEDGTLLIQKDEILNDPEKRNEVVRLNNNVFYVNLINDTNFKKKNYSRRIVDPSGKVWILDIDSEADGENGASLYIKEPNPKIINLREGEIIVKEPNEINPNNPNEMTQEEYEEYLIYHRNEDFSQLVDIEGYIWNIEVDPETKTVYINKTDDKAGDEIVTNTVTTTTTTTTNYDKPDSEYEKLKYYDFIIIREHDEENATTVEEDNTIMEAFSSFISDDFFTLLKSKDFKMFNPPTSIKELILNLYFDCYTDKNTNKINYDLLFKHINGVSVTTKWEDFYATPFLLYFLRKFELIITIKEDTKKEWCRR